MKIKLWHLLALSGLLWACTRTERRPPKPIAGEPPDPDPRQSNSNELDIFVHDRALIPTFLTAASRIEKASGIKIHVNRAGTLQTAVPIFSSDFLCPNGKDGWSSREFLAMARNCKVNPEKVAVHELLHQLGVTEHLAPPKYGILLSASDNPSDTITSDDLEALCAVRDCTVFAPES